MLTFKRLLNTFEGGLILLHRYPSFSSSRCNLSGTYDHFTGKGDTDPSLDSDYVPYLKSKCKPTDTTTLLEMDPGSFRSFDEKYYNNRWSYGLS
ncbi:hypothetical protein L6452_16312 [Arctium lappa]|uniref:Uncharacterized protein n=1 Tax=Arctium lappa TaxID=4217 RepID=A0ACB9C092_ARCLA|nr:hypothetical protein L6452_16312 [Arctium lappa]